MRNILLFAGLIFLLIIVMPVAGAVIEEEWGNYKRIDEKKRDGEGQEITLNWLKKTYTNPDENYTVTVQDFDAQGNVIMIINFKGKNETLLLSGMWNDNRTKVIVPEPIEAFDKTMNISTLEIVPPAGVFTCCPEVRIKINLIRPELFLEFDKDDNDLNDKDEKLPHGYTFNTEVPIIITVTNYGDDEAESVKLLVDTDGLLFENGKSSYDLPPLEGEDQIGNRGLTNQTIKLGLRFPPYPGKINYSVHAYVKGEKNNIVYYYDDIRIVELLPSINISKSVTEESILMERKDVESIYPSVDSDEITRWMQSKDIFVTLGVTNYANYGFKNVSLHDTISNQFIIENQSLDWTFDIKPGEIKEFTYKIFTDRPGSFTLPSAILNYSDLNMTWNVKSNNPKTEVHGSCIQIFKKTDKSVVTIGNNTNITVNMRNIGDMPSKVTLNDSIPENSTLLEGKTFFEGVILPKETSIFSYMISMDSEGQFELPKPILYVNGKKSSACGEIQTARILVRKYTAPRPIKTIIVPTETPIEVKNPEEVKKELLTKYNWLEGVIPAFMLILAIVVLSMLYRKNV